jgi:hypothetical protein
MPFDPFLHCENVFKLGKCRQKARKKLVRDAPVGSSWSQSHLTHHVQPEAASRRPAARFDRRACSSRPCPTPCEARLEADSRMSEEGVEPLGYLHNESTLHVVNKGCNRLHQGDTHILLKVVQTSSLQTLFAVRCWEPSKQSLDFQILKAGQ